MNDLEGLVGKKIKLVFSDGSGVNARYGLVKCVSTNFIEIEAERGIELIAIDRIVRIEKGSEGNG